MGHATMYMQSFQLIIQHLYEKHRIQAIILSLNYSLSPENAWPKACNESMDAYRYLISTLDINPSNIILAGDSAGANLVASTLLAIQNQRDKNVDIPLPLAAALLSPWVDVTPYHASFESSDVYDYLTPFQIATFTSCYISDYKRLDEKSKVTMLRNPYVSPFYGDFSNILCPLLVAYGEQELLKKMIEEFISNLRRDGCDVSTLKGENASHDWLMHSFMARTKVIFERDCKTFIDWMALKKIELKIKK